MEVPALDVVVPRPHARFCVREHDVDRLPPRAFRPPNVEVERRFAVARRAKARCSSDVVDDQLGYDAQAAVARRAHEVDEVAQRPQSRIDRGSRPSYPSSRFGVAQSGISHRQVTPSPAR